MRYVRYVLIELKVILFRIPIVLFFSIVFPLMMMVIVVSSTGNIDIGNGFHLTDKYIMIAAGIGLVPLGLVSLPVSIAIERETGVMERYMLFGINPLAIVWSKVVVHVLMAVLQFSLICLFAKLIYTLSIPNIVSLLSFLLHYILAVSFMLLFGVMLGLVVKKIQAVQVIGLALMFMVLAMSGGFNEFHTLPAPIQNVMDYFPVKYLMNDFISIWFNTELVLNEFIWLTFGYLVVIGLIIMLLIRHTFKFNYQFKQLTTKEKHPNSKSA
ncbi:ABC transporter permease [Lentibacillus saliphilus]|uniref:ABC transporter permease n=1 Tax=Lentibacillus saliphilus TaxID=2737028 RepID=UPI001C2F5692|nr:ABC transporter permease [Lentibacillus saliphilus]